MAADSGAFYFDQEGFLCTGNVRLADFVNKFTARHDLNSESFVKLVNGNELVPHETRLQTPIVLYSKKRLLNNLNDYKNSFRLEVTDKLGIDVSISYSLKANFNPTILKLFFENATWVSLVNKNELKLARRVGFPGEKLIFNGNGKKLNEIALVLKSKCFINIDSQFNLRDTLKVANQLRNELDSPAKLLLRVNVSSSAQVHSYLDTTAQSKFGIEADRLDSMIEEIKSNGQLVTLAGFHIHLGSTIKLLDVYRNSVANLVTLINCLLEKHDLKSIELINFGGGLGIDYERFAHRTKADSSPQMSQIKYPTPQSLAELIGENVAKLKVKNVKIVVEPGRSLVGDSAVLLTSLIGVKRQEKKNFMVVDASMCECIRPCLYSAYHHIDFIGANASGAWSEQKLAFDVVGPVCESGDFLGKDRFFRVPECLPSQNEADQKVALSMVVMDVGAYCSSMANNYNLHQKPAEVLIEEVESGVKYLLTRRPDSLDDILGPFVDY